MTSLPPITIISRATESTRHRTSNQTIGLAVGLGIGVPVLLTIIILSWMTIRHYKKMKEEDEMDKDIDFNGDVSFWAEEVEGQKKAFSYCPPGTLPAAASQSLGGSIRGSRANSLNGSIAFSGLGPRPPDGQPPFDEHSIHPSEDGASSYLTQSFPSYSSFQHTFAPEISQTGSQENFAKALKHIYGPSFAYPSSEKLRAPSVSSIRSLGMAYSGSSVGPFATPPRHLNGSPQSSRFHARTSSGSCISDDEIPLPPVHKVSFEHKPLQKCREIPHPYANLAGVESSASVHTAMSTINPPETKPNEAQTNVDSKAVTRHAYHRQARDHTSTFDFQPQVA